MLVVALGLFGVACTVTPLSAGGGGLHAAECPAGAKWAVGDSFTTGVYQIPGWPDQDPPIPAGTYVNLGEGGAVVPQLKDQLDLDLPSCPTGGAPSEVVFLAGANDMANSRLGLTQMKSNINALVTDLQGRGVTVKLVSVLPIQQGADWSSYDNQRVLYNTYMQTTWPASYIDCSTPLQSGRWLNPAYAYGDGAHLDQAGFEMLAGCINSAA
jgi:lysophospholipase L1-like esterase